MQAIFFCNNFINIYMNCIFYISLCDHFFRNLINEHMKKLLQLFYIGKRWDKTESHINIGAIFVGFCGQNEWGFQLVPSIWMCVCVSITSE
jgi:hypothetical protein